MTIPLSDRTPPMPAAAALTIDLPGIVAGLRSAREDWRGAEGRTLSTGGRELPSSETMVRIVDGLRGALFPMRLGPAGLRQETEDYYVGHTLASVLSTLLVQVRLELCHVPPRPRDRDRDGADDGAGADAARPVRADDGVDARALTIVRGFGAALPGIRSLLDSDVRAAFDGDPAARSVDEVLLCYPGVLAMTHHRLAHALYRLGAPLLARLIAEHAHSATGIDIHPGAQIGPGFFIDHGTGVVIGETAVIGRNVRLYQAVTLGAKRFATAEDGRLQKGGARHPVVEDDVVVYAGATILGRVTVGRGSSIGGNVWLTRSVPPGSRIAQADLRDDAARQTVPDGRHPDGQAPAVGSS